LSRNKLDSKPFQTECFKWCIGKEKAQAHQAQQVQAQQVQAQQVQAQQPYTKQGGILALEMGLGKTIIMLGLIKCNLKQNTLIVLPRSLLDQWETSIIKFCGVKPLVYHGSRPKSMKMSLAAIKACQIIVTTYVQMSLPSLKQEFKGRKRSLLHAIEWNRVICDEAHHVSHQKTNEFKGVQIIRTEICWLVTGTPIQNNEKELYTLYSLFGLPNRKFYYTDEIYAETAKQIIFYSTKAGVGIVLPALHEHVVNIEWENDSEREFAYHIHSLLSFCNVPQKSIATQIEEESGNLNALRMKYLARAQQVCAYPPILHRAIAHFETLLYDLAGEEYPNMDILELQFSQSKINALMKTLLERKGNGCGKIVFCHYYAEIDAIEARLTLADPTLKIAKFDGRVPNSKRADVLSQPVDILLAQIKMCREGLNLQDNYSEVYFTSPDFNPATEQQAIARCWRIGQKKEVHVFRYIMGGNPPHPPVAGNSPLESVPLTIDLYASQLHVKKQMFVERMAASSMHV